jgi:hypothetical protein
LRFDSRPIRFLLATLGLLAIPVPAIGAEKFFVPAMAPDLRFVALDVTEGVFPNSGYWMMEGQPTGTAAAVRAFLEKR